MLLSGSVASFRDVEDKTEDRIFDNGYATLSATAVNLHPKVHFGARFAPTTGCGAMNVAMIESIAGGGAERGPEGAQESQEDGGPATFKNSHGKYLGITLHQIRQRAFRGFFTAYIFRQAQMCYEALLRSCTPLHYHTSIKGCIEGRFKRIRILEVGSFPGPTTTYVAEKRTGTCHAHCSQDFWGNINSSPGCRLKLAAWGYTLA